MLLAPGAVSSAASCEPAREEKREEVASGYEEERRGLGPKSVAKGVEAGPYNIGDHVIFVGQSESFTDGDNWEIGCDDDEISHDDLRLAASPGCWPRRQWSF